MSYVRHLWQTGDIVTASQMNEIEDGIVEALENSEGSIRVVTPLDFGAKGDGTADDTQAMLDCVNYCDSNNKTLYVPKDCTIYLPLATSYAKTALTTIRVMGTIKAPNGVEFRRSSSLTGNDWYFNNIDGTLKISGLKNSIVTIVKATALVLYADSEVSGAGSIAYNQFYLGYVPSVTLDGYNNGWINENVFVGGRLNVLRIADNGGYSHNHNHFYNPTLEDATVAIEKGHYNHIHNARFEGTYSVTFGPGTRDNFVSCSWQSALGPGEDSGMSVTDTYGRNYWTRTGKPFTKEYIKTYDINSYNYNTDRIYPLNGKLHCTAGALFATKIIPISKAVNVYAASETTFFRGYIEIYDQNMEKITTEPATNPIKNALGLSWDSINKYYGFKSTNRASQRFDACRYSGGTDTGVYFIKFWCYVPSSQSANVQRFVCKITTNYYTAQFTPWAEDKMSGSHAPAAGDWANGNVVWNTGTTETCAGWFYQNNAWHAFGEYTT